MAKEADIAAMRLLVDLLADKWTLPVLGALCENGGCQRFNALLRGISDISQKSLSVCLKRLEANGLIERIVATQGQLAVEYKVTTLGHSLELPIAALLLWSNENVDAIRAARDHRVL
jgi:DNA-binding HxlR family transcriptional regulator